jgi:hypothetical protein
MSRIDPRLLPVSAVPRSGTALTRKSAALGCAATYCPPDRSGGTARPGVLVLAG